MQFIIDNNRGDANELSVLLTGKDVLNLKGIELNTSTPLSSLAGPISMDTITIGRLYVGYGTFPLPQPAAGGPQYYGWVEFTKKAQDPGVFINLTNVGLVGLPLALAGVDTAGAKWSLGYKESTLCIIEALESEALVKPGSAAVIRCTSGQTKILAPDQAPTSYRLFDTYLTSLTSAEAKLIIESDAPKDGSPVTFVGSFKNARGPKDVILSMTGEFLGEPATFEITKENFTSEILYRCDGGQLLFNGKPYPDNVDPARVPPGQGTVTNSTFRNLCVGMNEGYFTPMGSNDSRDFGQETPFADGRGNQYAQIIHANSNSYGFPYADKNLKVEITARPTDPITLTILADDQAFGYHPPSQTKPPPSHGKYQFGIGTGSSSLGTIKIEDVAYGPTPKGAYGGFLPTVSDWTKMIFTRDGDPRHIWIKTTGKGEVEVGEGFVPAPTWLNRVLTWGAGVSWNGNVPSPPRPSGGS